MVLFFTFGFLLKKGLNYGYHLKTEHCKHSKTILSIACNSNGVNHVIQIPDPQLSNFHDIAQNLDQRCTNMPKTVAPDIERHLNSKPLENHTHFIHSKKTDLSGIWIPTVSNVCSAVFP